MTVMVRKQIYLEPRQDELLKRLAKKHKMSEAELIRQAIDRQIDVSGGAALPRDPAAWQEAYRFMLALRDREPLSAQEWTRDELYEERLSRYDRHSG
jgi:hypothetical protein